MCSALSSCLVKNNLAVLEYHLLLIIIFVDFLNMVSLLIFYFAFSKMLVSLLWLHCC